MINFIIAGAFSHFTDISLFFIKNKSLVENFNFTVYDGINNCKWNGGRINRDIHYDDRMIEYYYSLGVGIALTLSNPIIDLSDETGNHLLEKFHKEGNRLILTNASLRKYIRKNFPKYKLTYSITGLGKISLPMSDSDFNRYLDLESKYDLIVPRSEHIFDKRFKELNQEKYEIMLNDTCIYNCPKYGEHFEKIAEQNRLEGNPWEKLGQDHCFKVEECWVPSFDFNVGDLGAKEKHGENYGMDLESSQIKRLMSSGVKHFKISGREMNSEQLTYELKSYLVNKMD